MHNGKRKTVVVKGCQTSVNERERQMRIEGGMHKKDTDSLRTYFFELRNPSTYSEEGCARCKQNFTTFRLEMVKTFRLGQSFERDRERERGKSGIRNDKKRGDRMIKVRAHTHFLVLNQAPFVQLDVFLSPFLVVFQSRRKTRKLFSQISRANRLILA